MIFTCNIVYSQGNLGIDPTRRHRETPPLLEDDPFKLPADSVLPPLKPISPKKLEKLPLIRVFVRDIKITGNTVFSEEELDKIISPYINRELTNEDLESIRLALTLKYVNNGYVNSGAIIPDQSAADGVITFEIIEGELTRIDLEGNKWFGDRYIRKRLAIGGRQPLNMNSLQESLRRLQQDSRIEQINAELWPDVKPGDSLLKVGVKDRFPYRAKAQFDNYQAPSIGAERVTTTASSQNLLGLGDIMSLTYGRSEGLERLVNVWYTIPITAHDTTLTLQFRRDDSEVVQEPFNVLDIESTQEIYNATVRHPFYRTPSQEFSMSITGERQHNETFLLGEPFAFSASEKRGKSTITALRFSQDWIHRSQKQVVAIRSLFSVGIDALGATNNDSNNRNGIADSQFFSWLGQFQWARRLKYWNIQTLLRTDIQLANKPLLPLEQIAVGGRYSVRGYRENQLVRDNAIIASFETRIPIIRNKKWADYVELVPFVDYGKSWYGRAWNRKRPHTPDPKAIASVGVGIRWAVTLPEPIRIRPEFEVFWGHRLNNIDTSLGEHDLQDDGVHFQLSLSVF
ncbi:MAG: ShlB/FhaC/HecB family hemolysin secretion/activation protein [Candidatus Brocadiaceae bacterium]|nr:ShlB/FhaC/HecB family hemolysin secretion/activation protein [Candidatus Brocadiaceae bacterium]